MTFYTPISITPFTVLRTNWAWIIYKVSSKRTRTWETVKNQVSLTNVRKACRPIWNKLVSNFTFEAKSLRASFAVGSSTGITLPSIIWVETLITYLTVIIISIETSGTVGCCTLSNTRSVIIGENESIITFVAYQLISILSDLSAIISKIVDSTAVSKQIVSKTWNTLTSCRCCIWCWTVLAQWISATGIVRQATHCNWVKVIIIIASVTISLIERNKLTFGD